MAIFSISSLQSTRSISEIDLNFSHVALYIIIFANQDKQRCTSTSAANVEESRRMELRFQFGFNIAQNSRSNSKASNHVLLFQIHLLLGNTELSVGNGCNPIINERSHLSSRRNCIVSPIIEVFFGIPRPLKVDISDYYRRTESLLFPCLFSHRMRVRLTKRTNIFLCILWNWNLTSPVRSRLEWCLHLFSYISFIYCNHGTLRKQSHSNHLFGKSSCQRFLRSLKK